MGLNREAFTVMRKQPLQARRSGSETSVRGSFAPLITSMAIANAGIPGFSPLLIEVNYHIGDRQRSGYSMRPSIDHHYGRICATGGKEGLISG